jgi:cell division protein FtsQ
VEVHGEHRASERLVDLTADVESGTPLARVDTDAIEERLRELRVVADADVERVWPHTLRITVVERTGVAVVRKGDSLHLVDSTGVDFAQVPGRVDGLPFIDVDLTATDPAVVTTALAVVDGLPPTIGRQVRSLEAHSIDDVRLRLRSGAVVLWGDASQGERKAEVLRALLRQRADRYDVRAPMAPTTTG